LTQRIFSVGAVSAGLAGCLAVVQFWIWSFEKTPGEQSGHRSRVAAEVESSRAAADLIETVMALVTALNQYNPCLKHLLH